jgi:hypothetical protein
VRFIWSKELVFRHSHTGLRGKACEGNVTLPRTCKVGLMLLCHLSDIRGVQTRNGTFRGTLVAPIVAYVIKPMRIVTNS